MSTPTTPTRPTTPTTPARGTDPGGRRSHLHVFSAHEDDMVFEEAYNVSARRVFPWPEAVEEPFWGGSWVDVAPGATSTPHSHDENEMFFVTEGSGILRIGDETRRVGAGETVFITPFQDHALTNDGDGRLRFVTIWWGGGEAVQRERARWAAVFGIDDPSLPQTGTAAKGAL